MYQIGGLKAVAQGTRGGDLPDLTGGVSRGVPRGASWGESEGLTSGSGAIGPSGRVRSLSRALFTCSCQGQPLGRCRVVRRAFRVIRPAREKKRWQRVLVVTNCWPKAIPAVQRARLCASAGTAS